MPAFSLLLFDQLTKLIENEQTASTTAAFSFSGKSIPKPQKLFEARDKFLKLQSARSQPFIRVGGMDSGKMIARARAFGALFNFRV